ASVRRARPATPLAARQPLEGQPVATEALGQVTRDAPDGRHAHAGELVDAPVRKLLLEQFDDLPAVGQRLELGWRTQVLEKLATFLDVPQAHDGPEQGILALPAAVLGTVSIRFHGCQR